MSYILRVEPLLLVDVTPCLSPENQSSSKEDNAGLAVSYVSWGSNSFLWWICDAALLECVEGAKKQLWESKIAVFVLETGKKEKTHTKQSVYACIWHSRILFRHMTHLITLKILLFPFLPLLFMLGSILALGVKDGDGMLDLQAFSNLIKLISCFFICFLDSKIKI